MIEFYASILVASLLGSLHCAGMCGPLACMVCATGPHSTGTQDALAGSWKSLTGVVRSLPVARAIVPSAAYNTGRLVAYLILGAIGGALGATLDLSTRLLGAAPMAARLAGVATILIGLMALAQYFGATGLGGRCPQWISHLFAGAHRAAGRHGPMQRAAAAGLLSALLPCGWLYSFVLIAAATASPLLGAAAMLVFWLGTVPVLSALSVGAPAVLGPLARRAPIATAIALVAIGLLTVTGRLQVDTRAFASITPPADAAGAALQAKHLDAHEMPCCHTVEAAP